MTVMLFLRLPLWAGLVMGRRVEIPFPLLLLPLLLSLSWPLCWVGMMEFGIWCVVEVGLLKRSVQWRYSGVWTGLLAKHRNPRFLSQNSTARGTGQFCTGLHAIALWIALKHTLHTLQNFLHCSELNWKRLSGQPSLLLLLAFWQCVWDLCCRRTRREGWVKINEQNSVLTSWQAAGLAVQ